MADCNISYIFCGSWSHWV